MSRHLGLATVVCCAGFCLSTTVLAQGLFAGLPSDQVGALPGRARKTTAPEIQLPLKYEAIRNESYPGLRASVLVGDSVIRLVGAGFGSESGGRTVMMKLSNMSEPVALQILSWKDDEIRVQVPALSELGIDGKVMSQMKADLGKKRLVGPTAEVGIQLQGKWAAKPKQAQLAVVYRDLDADGHDADDCDDLDARRAPGHKEVEDPEGLDEDCNPNTKGEAPVTSPQAATSAPAAVQPKDTSGLGGIDDPSL
jgi:hypothetical protein